MNDKLKAEIENLTDNRVWVTKKSRMEAEARMNKNNIFSQFLVNYYTFVVLAFSILALIEKETEIIALITVIASVGLFGTTLFLSSMAYREKAIQFKESYLRLSELESDLNHLRRQNGNDSDVIPKLQELEIKYNEIMAKTDNHGDIDFYKVQIMHGKKLTKDHYLNYYKSRIITSFFKVLLILVPLGLTALYLYNK